MVSLSLRNSANSTPGCHNGTTECPIQRKRAFDNSKQHRRGAYCPPTGRPSTGTSKLTRSRADEADLQRPRGQTLKRCARGPLMANRRRIQTNVTLHVTDETRPASYERSTPTLVASTSIEITAGSFGSCFERTKTAGRSAITAERAADDAQAQFSPCSYCRNGSRWTSIGWSRIESKPLE